LETPTGHAGSEAASDVQGGRFGAIGKTAWQKGQSRPLNPARARLQRAPGWGNRTGLLTLERLSMPTGVVKWYNPTKGFGFIQPEDGGKDVFVHVSAVERAGHGDPQEGDRISYDLEKGRDGRESATNLRAPDA
jgi:CspA family cold shock protein